MVEWTPGTPKYRVRSLPSGAAVDNLKGGYTVAYHETYAQAQASADRLNAATCRDCGCDMSPEDLVLGQPCGSCARVRRFTLLRFPVPPALQAEYDALPAPVPVPTDALLDALVARER
jgi:hypothetical protein